MRGPDAYPTVSGVAAAARVLTRRHPDLCRMRLAGESRAGRPLWLLSVGHGSRHVLVVAGACPDEQAGGATVMWLAEQAVTDRRRTAEADLTWDFLLCLDPDGAVLNETGPAGPRPAAVHYRHTYRPGPAELPERSGSFRAPGDELPETRALVAVIDELRPVVQCSLHGTDVGGGRVGLTGELPGLAEPFGKYAAELDIPVQVSAYDAGGRPPAGVPELLAGGPGGARGSTWSRPQRYGGITALVEVPMWATRQVADPEPHPDPAHAVSVLATRLRKDGNTAAASLDRALPLLLPDDTDSPLRRAVEQAVGAFPGLADDYDRLAAEPPAASAQAPTPAPATPLTTADVAALDIAARRLPLRAAGMLLRLLDEQRLDPDPNSEPARLRARLERRLDAGARDLLTTTDARWVPVGDQVELQARTVLAAVERLP